MSVSQNIVLDLNNIMLIQHNTWWKPKLGWISNEQLHKSDIDLPCLHLTKKDVLFRETNNTIH
jgi:hypothetical protein